MEALARVYENEGKHPEAEQLYKAVWDGHRKRGEPKSGKALEAEFRVGQLYIMQNRLNDAEHLRGRAAYGDP